jgi:hypothetical protein
MPAIDAIQKLPANILLTEANTTQWKLFKPAADQLDELTTLWGTLRTILEIEAMAGLNLDNLGQNLNELRQGRDDETYRVFLGVAIQQIASRGDLFSLNTIAEALGFTDINIVELFGGGLDLDGTRLLDGNTLLSGGDRAATFAFFQDLNVDDTTGDFAIATSINAVRAAGVFAQISFTFTSNQAQGVTTVDYSPLLDGTVLLDSETALNPNKEDLVPDEIALRDAGGEVLRKDAVTFTDEAGDRFHQITVAQSELDGVTIVTMQLFKNSVLLWTDTFTGKVKNDETIFVFKMKETD